MGRVVYIIVFCSRNVLCFWLVKIHDDDMKL